MFIKNQFFYLAGLMFLFLAKSKNILQGYSSPKPLDISQADACIDYDFSVVDHWLSHLQRYSDGSTAIDDKVVIELGPGSDLGIGLYLLSKGCAKYQACDVNNLIASTPDSFYERLFERLGASGTTTDIDDLRSQLDRYRTGEAERLNHVVQDDFDLVKAFGESSVDLVFSQAAFEHFDDIDETVRLLTAVCKPGAKIVAEIDLTTHSRWVRDEDPNNIYRFGRFVYNLFWFRGIPNRKRPYHYVEAFERNGWSNVEVTPLRKEHDHESSSSGMSSEFRDTKNQMDILTFMFCATRS